MFFDEQGGNREWTAPVSYYSLPTHKKYLRYPYVENFINELN